MPTQAWSCPETVTVRDMGKIVTLQGSVSVRRNTASTGMLLYL